MVGEISIGGWGVYPLDRLNDGNHPEYLKTQISISLFGYIRKSTGIMRLYVYILCMKIEATKIEFKQKKLNKNFVIVLSKGQYNLTTSMYAYTLIFFIRNLVRGIALKFLKILVILGLKVS